MVLGIRADKKKLTPPPFQPYPDIIERPLPTHLCFLHWTQPPEWTVWQQATKDAHLLVLTSLRPHQEWTVWPVDYGGYEAAHF